MDCPYCEALLENESQQYCPNCGKLVLLTVRQKYSVLISMKQLTLLVFAGFFSFTLIFCLFNSFNLFLSIEFYQGLISSLIMCHLTYFFFKKSDNDSMNDFFPFINQFFFILSLLMWFSIVWTQIVFDYIFSNRQIDLFSLFLLTLNFYLGFLLGILIILIYYTKINKNNVIKIDKL